MSMAGQGFEPCIWLSRFTGALACLPINYRPYSSSLSRYWWAEPDFAATCVLRRALPTCAGSRLSPSSFAKDDPAFRRGYMRSPYPKQADCCNRPKGLTGVSLACMVLYSRSASVSVRKLSSQPSLKGHKYRAGSPALTGVPGLES